MFLLNYGFALDHIPSQSSLKQALNVSPTNHNIQPSLETREFFFANPFFFYSVESLFLSFYLFSKQFHAHTFTLGEVSSVIWNENLNKNMYKTNHRLQKRGIFQNTLKGSERRCHRKRLCSSSSKHLFSVHLMFSLSSRSVLCSFAPFTVWCDGGIPLLCDIQYRFTCKYTTLIIA